MTMHKPTFEVDKEGLAKLLARHGAEGKARAVCELWQNAADEDGVTKIEIELKLHEGVPDGGPRYELTVTDDSPEGFANLAHAYTLFAESTKKGRSDQRGRFNLGEKLVIAICDYVQIATTKGTIEFTAAGRREFGDTRPTGTRFHAVLPMTEDEVGCTEAAVMRLIPPHGITTTYNGMKLAERVPLREFGQTLRTELADEEGYLRPTRRKATIGIYQPEPGEIPALYEMGIPVCETGDRWHVDIGQKVPLTTDRDNVPASYLRDVRTSVVNNCSDLLDPEAAGAKWVDDALESKDIEPTAVQTVVTERYGDKVVIEDPSDREGTKIAVSKGYAVIPAGAFSKEAWGAVKISEAALPAGQVTPSPNPHEGEDALDLIKPEHYTKGTKVVVEYAEAVARELLGAEITVRVANAVAWPYLATYGPRKNGKEGQLTLNYGRLGHAFFKNGRTPRVDALLIHEFAHHRESDHLSHRFHDACCDLGAELTQLALTDPEMFNAYDLRVGEKVAA